MLQKTSLLFIFIFVLAFANAKTSTWDGTQWRNEDLNDSKSDRIDYIIAADYTATTDFSVKSITINPGATLTLDGINAQVAAGITIQGQIAGVGTITNQDNSPAAQAILTIDATAIDLSAFQTTLSDINIINSASVTLANATADRVNVAPASTLICGNNVTISNLLTEQSSNNSDLSFITNGDVTITNVADIANTVEIYGTIIIQNICYIRANANGQGSGQLYIEESANFINYASSFSIPQSYYKKWSLDGYAYMCIPFNGQIHDFPRGVFEYRESNSYPDATWQRVSRGSGLTRGKGYISFKVGAKEFIGYSDLNDISVPVSYTTNNGANATDIGANLIGNPYACPLSFDAFMNANATIIESSIYFWDDGRMNQDSLYRGGDYIVKNSLGASGGSRSSQMSGDNIPSFQAFFVKALSAGNVTYTSSMILPEAVNSNLLKSETEQVPTIRLSLSNATLYNDVLIGLTNNVADYNAQKKRGNDAFSFFILRDNDSLGITSYHLQNKDTIVIPLVADLANEETMTFVLENTDQALTNYEFYLKNTNTKEYFEIDETPLTYTFNQGKHYEWELVISKQNNARQNLNRVEKFPHIVSVKYFSLYGNPLSKKELKEQTIYIERKHFSDGSTETNKKGGLK